MRRKEEDEEGGKPSFGNFWIISFFFRILRHSRLSFVRFRVISFSFSLWRYQVAHQMAIKGHSRTWEQCKTRIHTLVQKFRRTKLPNQPQVIHHHHRHHNHTMHQNHPRRLSNLCWFWLIALAIIIWPRSSIYTMFNAPILTRIQSHNLHNHLTFYDVFMYL